MDQNALLLFDSALFSQTFQLRFRCDHLYFIPAFFATGQSQPVSRLFKALEHAHNKIHHKQNI